MQLTTLNKVVSLFLVGGLVLLGGLCLGWRQLDTAFAASGRLSEFLVSKGTPLLVVAGALFLLSLAAAIGTACEILTALTVRRLLRKSRSNRWLAACFAQAKAFDNLMRWKEFFRSAAKDRSEFAEFVSTDNDQHWASRLG